LVPFDEEKNPEKYDMKCFIKGMAKLRPADLLSLINYSPNKPLKVLEKKMVKIFLCFSEIGNIKYAL